MNPRTRALDLIREELNNIRRHTGRSFVGDKWKGYNRYQYLDMKRRVIKQL